MPKAANPAASARSSTSGGSASTDLRTHLEHFDERLDRWHERSEHHNYADFVIGPKESTITGLEETDMFRHV